MKKNKIKYAKLTLKKQMITPLPAGKIYGGDNNGATGNTVNTTPTTIQNTTPGYGACDPITMSCPPPFATSNTVCACNATFPGQKGC
ncbi:hypothetical protein [Taibaiella koreensis]|uniref:hypothetical protein n=1 Tax=Taibaiella koreensis TaxID=1268548 RepID=UPI0013C2CD63|nr:hypothetical protein [Taibaiella koreensis]